jgi:hypothetical protein
VEAEAAAEDVLAQQAARFGLVDGLRRRSMASGYSARQ